MAVSNLHIQQLSEFLTVLSTKHMVDVEKDLHLPLHLGHTEQVRSGDTLAETGRILHVGFRQIQYLANLIHHNAHLHHFPCAHLNNDDAGTLGVLYLRQTEAEPQVDNRHDLAPEIDYTLDAGRRLRHRGYVLDSHNFPNSHHFDRKFFLSQLEGKIFAGARGVARFDRLKHTTVGGGVHQISPSLIG